MIERWFNRFAASDRADARGEVRLRGNQSPTLLLLLSLNLLLIVFFVVLNANADVDWQRSRVVLSSVQKSFGEKDETAAANAMKDIVAARLRAQDALRSSVSAAFASVLDGRDIVVRNAADRFWVVTPKAALFETETGKLRAVLPVLDRIAASLNAPPDGFRYEMTVTLNAAEGDEMALIQAGVLAEDLSRRDFGPTLFAVGLSPASDPGLTFTFQVFSDGAFEASAVDSDTIIANGGAS